MVSPGLGVRDVYLNLCAGAGKKDIPATTTSTSGCSEADTEHHFANYFKHVTAKTLIGLVNSFSFINLTLATTF